MIPYSIRNKFLYFANKEKRNTEGNDYNKIALTNFCVDLCKRTPELRFFYMKTYNNEQKLFNNKLDDMTNMLANPPSLASAGNVQEYSQEIPPSPFDFQGYYQAEPSHEGDIVAKTHPYQKCQLKLNTVPNSINLEDNSNEFQNSDFLQDSNGRWQRRHCISSPHEKKLPGSSWYGEYPPPPVVREEHTKQCSTAVGKKLRYCESIPAHDYNHKKKVSFLLEPPFY